MLNPRSRPISLSPPAAMLGLSPSKIGKQWLGTNGRVAAHDMRPADESGGSSKNPPSQWSKPIRVEMPCETHTIHIMWQWHTYIYIHMCVCLYNICHMLKYLHLCHVFLCYVCTYIYILTPNHPLRLNAFHLGCDCACHLEDDHLLNRLCV